MIGNKNIADNAWIMPHKLAGSYCGEIFWVANKDSNEYEFLRTKVKSGNLFPAESTNSATAINAAVAACVSGRGDQILIAGKSIITTAIVITSKENIWIRGIPNSDTPHGCQSRIANSSCNIFELTNSQKITIDGIRMTVTGAYSGITLAGGNGCFQAVIRDLAFQLNGASAKGISSSVANAAQAGTFENLYFRGYAVAKSSHGIHLSNTSTGNLFRDCYFYGLDNGIVATDSAHDIFDHVNTIDCTASLAITGATSSVIYSYGDVAATGTAKGITTGGWTTIT